MAQKNSTICPTKAKVIIFFCDGTTEIFKNHIIRNDSYVFMQCSLLLQHFHYHICLNNTMVTKVNKSIRHSLDRPAEKTRSGTL